MKHGDCSTNIAMIVAKKKGLKPIEYANEIVGKLKKIAAWIS